MSYDLNFFKKEDSPITKSEIINYLMNQENMSQKGDSQWVYQNNETGVYCSFDYYEIGKEDDDLEEENFNGFKSTDFSFNINFIRPQFFGNECFPLVERMAKTLSLFISNPQGDELPQQYNDGALNEDWGTINLRFAKSQFQRLNVNYLDLEKSNAAWEFTFNRDKLQDILGGEYFVPKIFFIIKKEDNEVSTLCVWPKHIPFTLPSVDFILIQKKYTKLFRTKEVSGLIAYDSLIKHLGKNFKDKNGYKIIHPNDAKVIKNQFNDLPLIGSLEEFGEGVAPDSFVNARDDTNVKIEN